ncbi:cytochrome c oxidase accessory protein CcoG [Microbulbifer harenosus]|uniref:Cytochrome c oxidase accessory protein CcoG n=1 Tax=Microbulbifer harenosus TaxID=2576840 RepID=A0ABY2UH16_9GAMM|nr:MULTISPECIES: cytochrome c oxidase accessory protein CcoG [Microbulbifer]QIL88539.1 cytochrome c oxidase accessory protein CcoG [Microbulbifer sp. SH-1]TLM77057.1 cytochrome c oxidase accessory protein CcoG [Microbulbifer harenosus]
MEKIPVVQEPVALHSAPPPTRDGKFHVRLTEGYFQNVRRLISWPLLALYFGLVWVQFDGQPWLLFSFEQHRIILFGHALSWRDLSLLAGLLIASAALLFFLAVAWGRVWCGFACPQSIWTWLFIRVEDLTEGRADKRARQAGAPLGLHIMLRRLLKHLLWILLALATAITFTGYFVPVREILSAAVQFELSAAVSGWILIMAGLTYLNAGLVREKICLHACPYARFQGVMFDEHTLTVSYDARRGEPRANLRKGSDNSGDCVDCGLCVQVCPAGIDIRDGLQAACIDCAACIDACDKVMSKLERPAGLIRFASEAQLQGENSRFLRPRLAGYAAVMLLAFTAVLYGFTQTTQLLVEIRRDRGAMFRQVDQHTVCNVYQVKVEGYSETQRFVDVSISGEGEFRLFGPRKIDLAEDSAYWFPYRVCARDLTLPKTELTFHFRGETLSTVKNTTFLTRSY